MDVTINNKVQAWANQRPLAAGALTAKCTEVHNNRYGGWRVIKKDVYDFMVPGATDYKIVAVASGTTFAVKAVYSHANGGGKKKEAGETVAGY